MAEIRVTQAGRQAPTQEDADIRVTQAGRQVAAEGSYGLRVTQAGRQALVDESGSDIRVTQAGRQALVLESTADLRVTQMGRQMLFIEPRPTRPILFTPATDVSYSDAFPITYSESTDPLEGTIWYHFRYKKQSDTAWTTAFTDKTEVEIVWEEIDELDDGDYEAEMWASTVGYESTRSTVDFVIHNGVPTAPIITAPYWGQELQQENNDVEWLPATDPQDDVLTYHAHYRAVGSDTWLTLFDDDTSPYTWNMTALAVDDYEFEIWANDGIGNGRPAYSQFSVNLLDRPSAPRLKILSYTDTTLEIELGEYEHPQDRAWQTTRYEIIPWGGDWSNRTFFIETTDSTYQLWYLFEGMAPGFKGLVRATFEDNNNTWGDTSQEVYFELPAGALDYERRWARTGHWTAGGTASITAMNSRVGQANPIFTWPGPQENDAIVISDSEELGSFYMEGWIQIAGCNCGWIGLDTEFRVAGFGVFSGNSDLDNEEGCYVSLRTGLSAALPFEGWGYSQVPGAMGGELSVEAKWLEEDVPAGSSTVWEDDVNGLLGAKVIPLPTADGGMYYNAYGIPLGMYAHPRIPDPWYHVKFWCQRNVSNDTTRLRASAKGYDDEGLWTPSYAGEWQYDLVWNRLTPCGQPGFIFAQRGVAFGWPAETHFRNLQVTALRDEGQEIVVNVSPLTPFEDPTPGVCTPVTEDALSDPVFFPAPPNGDVKEEIIFPTDVIMARDDTEQRVSLRTDPVLVVGWTCTLPTVREITWLKSLVFGNQDERWGIPMWMDATTLAVDLSSGSGTIPAASIDTEHRQFGDADYVCLWVDQYTWDFTTGTLNGDGSITLGDNTTRDYDAHVTQVIPVRIGRMAERLNFPRSAPYISDLEVEFVMEAIDG